MLRLLTGLIFIAKLYHKLLQVRRTQGQEFVSWIVIAKHAAAVAAYKKKKKNLDRHYMSMKAFVQTQHAFRYNLYPLCGYKNRWGQKKRLNASWVVDILLEYF